jgi:uridine phosphorylase
MNRSGLDMLRKSEFPILEFDYSKQAKIEPSYIGCKLSCDKLIITFFHEVLEKLIQEDKVKIELTVPGENPLKVYNFIDEDVLIVPGTVGCPACGGNLDALCGMGIKKVMFCGGGGVLDSNIGVGDVLLVDGAIRDEGFSYHYIEPSRYIYTNKVVTDRIARYLDEHDVSYTRGITWTTDALFRETEERIKRRTEEGAKIVEMEQSGCISVTQFRNVDYGALIYGGDDVSQDDWDERSWRSREGIRYDLVMLSKELLRVI